MFVFIKEITSKLEIVDYKKFIRKIYNIKNKKIKKIIKFFLKLYINLYYNYFCFKAKIKEEKNNSNIVIFIPIYKKCKYVKLINNINRNLEKYENKNIIISENLKKIDIFKNNFENTDYIRGKFLLKYMVDDVISYICNINKENVETQNVFLLVNEYNTFNLEIIDNLSEKFKNISIVTNNLKRFLEFTNKMYEKNGIMCTVSNNKRKALSRAKFVVNIDFTKEAISEFAINRDAIFINPFDEKIILSKGFDGIIINGVEISSNSKNIKYANFFNFTDLYESDIYKIHDFYIIRENLFSDNIKIDYLIGTKGRLIL